MSIREIVVSHFEEMLRETGNSGHPLTDDLVLIDCGVDSLGIAILVSRLEECLGVDPFTDSDISAPPVTVGEFIQLYERAGKSDPVYQGCAD